MEKDCNQKGKIRNKEQVKNELHKMTKNGNMDVYVKSNWLNNSNQKWKKNN